MAARPLTLAFALLLTASSPLLSLSLPLSSSLPRRPYHYLFLATTPPSLFPLPPPPLPPPPPSQSPSSLPPRDYLPCQTPPSSTPIEGTPGMPPPTPPPVSCASAPESAFPPNMREGPPSREAGGGSARHKSELNLGKKVGLSFVAVAAVLQLVLGSFLVYKRWQITKAGYQRHVSSSSPSAWSSAT